MRKGWLWLQVWMLATTAVAPAGAGTPGSDEARVRAVVDRYYETAKNKDWPGMAALLADDFRLYADGAEVFDKSAYMALLERESLGVERMELRDLEVRAAGRTAWCRFRGFFKHSATYSVETAETLIFEKRGEDWRIVHSQASVKEVKETAGDSPR
jgi:ketosteroid isomerase-like protein